MFGITTVSVIDRQQLTASQAFEYPLVEKVECKETTRRQKNDMKEFDPSVLVGVTIISQSTEYAEHFNKLR